MGEEDKPVGVALFNLVLARFILESVGI